MPKKKIDLWMPPYMQDDEEQEAYLWCIHNDVRVSPMRVKGEDRKWWLEYSLDGKNWHRSKHNYDEEQIWPKFFEMCKYFKDKNT